MISRRLLRIKVLQTYYSHQFVNDKYDVTTATKELNKHISQFHRQYIMLLDLMSEVKKYAERKYDIEVNKFIQNKDREIPYLKLFKNKLISKFLESDSFHNYKKNYGIGWAQYQDLVKEITNEFIKSEIFDKYLNKEQNFENDQQLIRAFYDTFLLKEFPELYQSMEEMSIYWADTTDYALKNCAKTVMIINEDDFAEDIQVLPVYKQKDDLDFAISLLQYTINNQDKLFEHIKPFISQWDFDRLFKLDTIILQLAITEFLEYPTIPLLATVDEYVEIAKEYCTDKSWSFINGVLDRIIHHLCQQNKIKKIKDGCEKFTGKSEN